MIKLIAKNQSDKRYYFHDDNESVYLINAPLSKSEAVYIDKLTSFLRKHVDSDLVYDEKDFYNIDDLRDYAIRDCTLNNINTNVTNDLPLDDLLLFAPTEIVTDYLNMIQDMINRNDFINIGLFFKQLSNSITLQDDSELKNRYNNLLIEFINVLFPFITNNYTIVVTEVRIKKFKSIYTLS